jgi:hypothetical protein
MNKIEIDHLNGIRLFPEPDFKCEKWNVRNMVSTREKDTHSKYSGIQEYSCRTPHQYMRKMYAFRYFDEGNSTSDVSFMLDMSVAIVCAWFEEFLEQHVRIF